MSKEIISLRYWYSDGVGMAVVAVITPGIDWSAYIGAVIDGTEEVVVKRTADYGSKLMEHEARAFAVGIKDIVKDLPYRL